MEAILHTACRKWVSEEHLRNVLTGEWVSMFDSNGKLFQGIRGRIGAGATTVDGTEIGVDLIEMQPGSEFPLHVHDGDHILYVLSGAGSVHIEGVDLLVCAGDTIFIAAELPHGVKGPPASALEPLIFLAFGHPHKHVDAHDRMKHPHVL